MYNRPRIIPCLLIQEQGLVKTVKFSKPNYLGDVINAVKIFNEKEVDELCLLDITASTEGRGPDFSLLRNIASEAFMPMSYGGGISVSDSLAEVTSKFNMYDGIVAYNTSLYGGGIAFRGISLGVIKNADISYNYSSGNSAGVVVWDDNTKADFYDCRITNNLS